MFRFWKARLLTDTVFDMESERGITNVPRKLLMIGHVSYDINFCLSPPPRGWLHFNLFLTLITSPTSRVPTSFKWDIPLFQFNKTLIIANIYNPNQVGYPRHDFYKISTPVHEEVDFVYLFCLRFFFCASSFPAPCLHLYLIWKIFSENGLIFFTK